MASHAGVDEPAGAARAAIIAGAFGNLIEWYDGTIYGLLAAALREAGRAPASAFFSLGPVRLDLERTWPEPVRAALATAAMQAPDGAPTSWRHCAPICPRLDGR